MHGLRICSLQSSELDTLESFFCTELLRKLYRKTQKHGSVTDGLDEHAKLSHELKLNCPIDWFVIIANNAFDYLKSEDENFVTFKPSLADIRNPSLAEKFLQVLFSAINFLLLAILQNHP